MEVVLVENLLEPLRDRFEVPSGKTSVRREPLRDDKEVPCAHGQHVVIESEESSHVDEGVLFRAHGRPVCIGKHLPHDGLHRDVRVPALPLLDEVSVLREPAGVEEERYAAGTADGRRRADVLHRDGLSAA